MSNEAVGEAQANTSKPVNMSKELAAFYQALGNLNGVLVRRLIEHPEEIVSITQSIRDLLEENEDCPGGQTFDLTASVTLISTLQKKVWSRPPIRSETLLLPMAI